MTQMAELQNPVKEARNFGQSIWFDGLVSKEEFRKMIIQDGVRGATTNPTIFEKEISANTNDSEFLHYLKTHSEAEIIKKLCVKSVQDLADLFLPVYEETNGEDGYVSIEVSPLLAYDTEGTIKEARELHSLVGRKNILVKVPATERGVPAVQALIAEGISVNVTLIFSVERYLEVMKAYQRGLECRDEDGLPVTGIASVASFFVSRVDTAVDKILEEKIKEETDPVHLEALKGLLGKAAIANSKKAYQEFEKFFSSARFQQLAVKGAWVQRPLWASTGTKNPNYSDVLYVDSLVGPHTVNTLPPATFSAFRDHGTVAPRLQQGGVEAEKALRLLKSFGINLGEVTANLEEAGVQSFADSYQKIIQFIGTRKK